jgi:hypothetical protein
MVNPVTTLTLALWRFSSGSTTLARYAFASVPPGKITVSSFD